MLNTLLAEYVFARLIITMCAVFSFSDADAEESPYKPVKSFQRTAEVGLIHVANLTNDTDLNALYNYPPAGVTDLDCIIRANIMVFTWTSVGDYADDETGKDGLCNNNERMTQ